MSFQVKRVSVEPYKKTSQMIREDNSTTLPQVCVQTSILTYAFTHEFPRRVNHSDRKGKIFLFAILTLERSTALPNQLL